MPVATACRSRQGKPLWENAIVSKGGWRRRNCSGFVNTKICCTHTYLRIYIYNHIYIPVCVCVGVQSSSIICSILFVCIYTCNNVWLYGYLIWWHVGIFHSHEAGGLMIVMEFQVLSGWFLSNPMADFTHPKSGIQNTTIQTWSNQSGQLQDCLFDFWCLNGSNMLKRSWSSWSYETAPQFPVDALGIQDVIPGNPRGYWTSIQVFRAIRSLHFNIVIWVLPEFSGHLIPSADYESYLLISTHGMKHPYYDGPAHDSPDLSIRPLAQQWQEVHGNRLRCGRSKGAVECPVV